MFAIPSALVVTLLDGVHPELLLPPESDVLLFHLQLRCLASRQHPLPHPSLHTSGDDDLTEDDEVEGQESEEDKEGAITTHVLKLFLKSDHDGEKAVFLQPVF